MSMGQTPQEHRRRRLAERGLKRIEVSVMASDADLIRFIVEALAKDDDPAKRLRLAIEQIVPSKRAVTFEEWVTTLSEDEEP
jgi:Asp-tRNA(Asn)/Glu-tRNA(Gln) amidotransferase B subunit